ncbi:hypothetical protein FIU93_02835 [Labrenzia sp. THAF35]|uniref:DUF4145 domain-containing protein n=1 Tax=Labrenzia sp. THAF35 TaxID=2587854 RepID=UPI001269655D|nr:DUF4145 domain-containing protein [Labrenzia sp. THAF35]QFT65699.1 hypothetical protein FIU93_02835 [Labrenzia sp. THAF35]
MDRKLWKKQYRSFPHFTCPRCGKGTLRKQQDSFHQKEPRYIHNQLVADGILGEVSSGRFSGFLVCSNTFCGEAVAVAGDYQEYYQHQFDYDTGEDTLFEDTQFTPFFMRPAPFMIEVPKTLCKEAKKHIERAYDLFWVDNASCANRLRIVAEYLLDQLDIPRKGPKGSRTNTRLDLADRIALLEEARPGHEDSLNALRYVGNVGSHEGHMELEELLDCFELLEDAMIELLEERRAKLAEKARRIIENKGKLQK